MYIQKIHRKNPGKTSTSIILAHNYRVNGKIQRKIMANLTDWSIELVEDFSALLKGGKVVNLEELKHYQGKSCGALLVLKEIAHRIHLDTVLGKGKQAEFALLQIFARIIDQRSRLFIAREFIQNHAVKEVMGIDKVSEDMLYKNLDWISEHQAQIEQQLFRKQSKGKGAILSNLYLYDVTSSYLEGVQNELANWGYNRDGKKGKKQIVIGLLCDQHGDPVSVEVFDGNTQDIKTFKNQLEKLQKRFGVKGVVIVGDKGMIKQTQIKDINEKNWYYITSITKPQIETLLNAGVLQMSLFDEEPAEIECEGIRYVIRRNPIRVLEMKKNRFSKIKNIKKIIRERNEYLKNHSKAKIQKAWDKVNKQIIKLRLHGLVECIEKEQTLYLQINQAAIKERSVLDGCYAIKTNVSKDIAGKQIIHDRYKDLAMVEHAFRTLKTGLEEIRPVYVRKAKRTRGHILVCMLAYKIVKNIWDALKDKTKYTQKFIIDSLVGIQYIIYPFREREIKRLPEKLNKHQEIILKHLNIKLPTIL